MARKITSIVLKSIVVVSVIVGLTLYMVERVSHMLFFTLQSNIWIGVTCIVGLVLMIAKVQLERWMYVVKLTFTVSITLTGVVYCTMLAPFLGSQAFTLASTLLHVIVPVAAVADFFVYDYAGVYKWWDCLIVTVPPFYYLAFAGVGYALNWDFLDGLNYPYFFLDWGSPAGAFGFSKQSPYIGVFYYVLILLAFVVGVGALYVFLAKVVAKKVAKQ